MNPTTITVALPPLVVRKPAGSRAKLPAAPRIVPQLETPMLRIPHKIWGHLAVEGQWKPESHFAHVAHTVAGGLAAAAKAGKQPDIVETLSQSIAKSLMRQFEIELKRQRAIAFAEGKRVGAAEAYARLKAAEAVTEGAGTIFPKARHAVAKRDYAQADLLAQQLEEYSGTRPEGQPDTEEVPMAPVTSLSGWVMGAGLHRGQLAIQFRGSPKTGGPVVCVYPGRGRAAMEELLAASSAGKWVWANVYHAAYMMA